MNTVVSRRSGQDIIEDQIISTLKQWPGITRSMLTAHVAPYSRQYNRNWIEVLQDLIEIGVIYTGVVQRSTRSVTVYFVNERNIPLLFESHD